MAFGLGHARGFDAEDMNLPLDFLPFLDPRRSESVVLEKAVSHAKRRIFEGVFREIEGPPGTVQMLEGAFLHSFADFAIGDEMPLIHEKKIASRRSARIDGLRRGRRARGTR